MTLLSRDAILGAQDIQTKDVPVPEWGGSVRIRSMTVAERNEFVRRATEEDRHSVGVWLVSLLSVDGDGKPLFKAEDVSALEKKGFRGVDTVASAVLDLNKMSEKKIDEAEKNS